MGGGCARSQRSMVATSMLAFAFPAEAGTHLATPEEWKAELALVAGWLHTEINVRHRELNLKTVTDLSTNRARR